MANLGSLGTERPQAEPNEFGWFTTTIRTNPGITDLVLADFMETATAIDMDNAEQAAASLGLIKQFLRDMIHPDDFDRFWFTAKQHGQGIEDLLGVAKAIIAEASSRPTMLPSVSTDGQPRTPENSASALELIAEQAFPGRPDLQSTLLRAAEQRSASSSM